MALKTQIRSLRFLRDLLLSQRCTGMIPYTPDPKPEYTGRQPTQRLPRTTPEEEKMSSGALAALYRSIAAERGGNAHALIVARHGRVVSEGWFAPYRPGVWHVTHSLCKSFTGTAVGIAIGEGHFRLEDRVADYFPEYCNFFTSRRTRAITVRHLLTMSSGISFNEMGQSLESDWLRGIFESEILFEPGSHFLYNSMNSYLLSALIKRTTGQGLVEFLTPRIFEPLGFGPVGWEKCPRGIEKGGWGMYLDPEDMLKFGQLYLQRGRWQTPQGERQLIPESWVEQATRTQIKGREGEYGWHIWTDSSDGSFLMNGMFGQYVAVFPHQQVVAVLLSGSGNLFAESASYRCLREGIAAACSGQTDGHAARADLERVVAGLEYMRPAPAARRPGLRRGALRWLRRFYKGDGGPRALPELEPFCAGSWEFGPSRGGLLPMILQVMDSNFSSGLRRLRLRREEDRLLLDWEEEGGKLCLPVGLGSWERGSITLRGETFLTAAKAELRPNEDLVPVLILTVCLPEHSSGRRIKLSILEDGRLLVRMDENPSLTQAIEKVIGQAASTGGKNPLSDLLLGNDYARYRVDQLIAPHLVGKPQKK